MDFVLYSGFALLFGYLVFFQTTDLPFLRVVTGCMLIGSLWGLWKTIPRMISLSRHPFITEVVKKIEPHIMEFRIPLPAQALDIWLYIHGDTPSLRGKAIFQVGERVLEEVRIEKIKSHGKSRYGTFWKITCFDNSNASEQKHLCVTTMLDECEPSFLGDYQLDVIVGLQPQ